MSTSPSSVAIRPLQTWDEYLAAEELQRIVWQMPDWRDAVPANLMITIQKNSGIVLGAFVGAQLVGLALSFIGVDHHLPQPTLKQHSHMLAVLHEYQAQKIGVQLKLVQRELTLAQGIGLMTWTYDPLLARNANLNLVRLGALARRYIPDAYGEMTDGLNAGLASDRFEVEWWLETPRARQCAANQVTRADWEALIRAGAHPIFQTERDAHSLLYIRNENPLTGDVLLVEIPSELPALKAAAPGLAREWRARTRDVFQRAFAAGYAATDFVFASRAAYVLTHEPIDTFARPHYNS